MEETTEAYYNLNKIEDFDGYHSAPETPTPDRGVFNTFRITLDSDDSSDDSGTEVYDTPREDVCKFFLNGKCRFGEECFYLHPQDGRPIVEEIKTRRNSAENETQKKTWKRKTETRRRKIRAEDEVDNNRKKPSMKTAKDVISRILWDELLPMEHFVVGYLDRFQGIVERSFSEFTWEEDIASVDDFDSLAVPRHRVQYFKYKGQKVWDKNERLDIVFGSVTKEEERQSTIRTNILDFMREVDKNQPEDTDTETEQDSDSDSDSEGGNIRQHVYREKSDKPNFFLCIRVTNEGIREKAKEILDHVRDVHPAYAETLTTPESLHITLNMLRMDTATEMSRAEQLLRNHKDEFMQFLWPPVDLVVNGLKDFKSRVVYGHIEFPDAFLAFANTVERLLRDNNIRVIKDFPEFVPHMTLFKIKRGSEVEKTYKYINPFIYQPFFDTSFGIQSVNNMNLCYTQERREDGFYRTICEIPLTLALSNDK